MALPIVGQVVGYCASEGVSYPATITRVFSADEVDGGDKTTTYVSACILDPVKKAANFVDQAILKDAPEVGYLYVVPAAGKRGA